MEPAKLDWARSWLAAPKNFYSNGRWHASSRTFATLNPATGETLCQLAEATANDVDNATKAAVAAGKAEWKRWTRRQRSETLQKIGTVIRQHRAELATLESLDNGKTYKEAYFDDLPESADVFDYYAGWIDKLYGESSPVENGFLNFTRREPVGVCALIVPWNFPLLLACWKIAPALAMGNTVIVKPSPFTPLTLIRLAELLHEKAGLPPGVFNVLTGGVECGEALAAHPEINKISFTGSTPIGKKIVAGAAQSNLKSVSLELGGKSPNIVFADAANLEAIADRAFGAMFSHKAEKCSEPTRLLLEDAIHDRVVEKLIQKAAQTVCGDPFDDRTTQGPQCHEAHLQKILGYIALGTQEGAKLVAGGERDNHGANARGYFVRPTIFTDVKPNMKIATDEIFGPVLSVFRFHNEAEAVQIANDSIYGLAAGLYTSDISRAHRVANELDAGQVFINHYGCYDFAAPFGGFKQSGWGKEMAIHSLDSYTKLKSIWVKF